MFTADLKLSITQPASFVCPSILSPVEGAGLGARRRLAFVSRGHQFSSLPARQTPPGSSCLAPSSALMDVSGWMGPPPPPPHLPCIPTALPPSPAPHPGCIQLRDRPHPVPEAGSSTQATSPTSLPLQKVGKPHILGAFWVPSSFNARSGFSFATGACSDHSRCPAEKGRGSESPTPWPEVAQHEGGKAGLGLQVRGPPGARGQHPLHRQALQVRTNRASC